MERVMIVACVLIMSLSGRSQEYSISASQDVYIELEAYSSIAIEEQGNFYWEKRFNLDFQFPFYQFNYDYIICDYESKCTFDNSMGINYPITLFTFGYEFDNVTDTNNLSSDVRYALIDNQHGKGLVIQFTKVRLISDPSIQEFDSYLSFQLWFIENGDVELRFGESNLNNSPCYVPGDGFYLIPENDPPVNLGPVVGLSNPVNDSIAIGVDGPFDSFEIVSYQGYLTTLPPPGWVIRFKRNPDATQDVRTTAIRLFPNPATTEIMIDSEIVVERIEILSTDGALIRNEGLRDIRKVDISDLREGMYLVRMYTGARVMVGKFVKM